MPSGTQPDEPGILAFMDRSLPSYAKPFGIEVMESFPRTSTGKSDRKKLAARPVE
jgi:acyl-CoA synthetase (AMP-forming)/AMP-acid ligase II